MTKKRVGVLISGRGSNLQALIEACRAPDYPAAIALVIANVPTAAGLARAEAAGIPTRIVNHKDFASRADFDAALDEALGEMDIELLCNAGFLRLHTHRFVEHWWNRHLNIHPSLLPAFPGLDTHARVIAAGCKLSGCTVHVVRPEMDAGPILAQAAVPVLAHDTPDTLAARVLQAEHRLYPHALALFASGAVRIEDERVMGTEAESEQGALFSPPLPRTL